MNSSLDYYFCCPMGECEDICLHTAEVERAIKWMELLHLLPKNLTLVGGI